MHQNAEHCWVIHDGKAGNRRQALALAQALHWPFSEHAVTAKGVSHWFAPHNWPGSQHAFGSDFARGLKAPPAFVIGCGREAALASRLLKQAGSFAIQILNPRINNQHWDVVITPRHDQVQGKNIISCLGSLHNVSIESLHQLRSNPSALNDNVAPRTLVLIGGPSRMALFNEGLIEVMFAKLEYHLATQGGSLMVCGSRRTPKLWADKIRARFSETAFPVWFDESDGENFYSQALANTDQIVITPDSVNMISEACATGLPVFIAQPERARGKMIHFLNELVSLGRIQSQTRELASYPVTPLNVMPDVIAQLQALIKRSQL